MPSLVIPESGMSLGSSLETVSKPGSAVPEVFGLTLSDGLIEEMIKCVQIGKPVQLSLGEQPNISYGNKIQHFTPSQDPFTHELYRSISSDSESSSTMASSQKANPNKGVVKVDSKPHAGFLAMFGKSFKPTKKPTTTVSNKSATSSTPASVTAGADAALAALKSSLAEENAKKAENTTKFLKNGGLPLPGERRGGPAPKVTNKSKFLAQNNRLSDTTRSMPTSPALSGVGSPSLGPTSVPLSQQQAEKAKSARKPVVHLLALSAMSEKELQAKIPDVTKEELNQVLDRVGDLNQGTRKWELRKNFWKELDVWTFNYEKDEDRHTAINNAVKQYDRMRMSRSDLQWDQLLPKSERGTGKCLSKLQAQIAQGPIARAPKVNVEKAQDSGRDTGDEADLFGDKNLSKAKGENMARSASQPPTTKAKKVSDREAQAKRLLSGNTKKPAAPKPAPKPAPAKKEKPKAGTKVLSSQFVSESDDEDSYMISSKPVLAPKAPTKRPREEDSTTSDSSVPLSKKIKKDVPTSIHRTSNASQTSHTTNSSTLSSISAKSKGTNSAHKSSPLASSPPTNASEVESPAGRTSSSSASPAHPSIKTSRSPIHKRHRASSSTSSSSSSTSRYLRREVLELAARYKSFYPKYLALHKEVMSMDDYKRDRIKEKDLFDMHDRLTNMKKEIMQGVIEAEEIAGGM